MYPLFLIGLEWSFSDDEKLSDILFHQKFRAWRPHDGQPKKEIELNDKAPPFPFSCVIMLFLSVKQLKKIELLTPPENGQLRRVRVQRG
jgi:hypothetical protein